MEKVKEAVQKVVNLGKTILKIIKKIPTLLGHICFWIIIAIMLVVLLYIVAHILAEAIAKLLDIDSGGIDESKDYKTLQGLVSSGYNEVMPAEELKNYYAYEYALLMDLARNIEETGVYGIGEEDVAPYDPAFLDRATWAALCAESLGNGGNAYSSVTSAYAQASSRISSAVTAGYTVLSSGGTQAQAQVAISGVISATSGTSSSSDATLVQMALEQLKEKMNLEKPSNEESKKELIYKKVKNDLSNDVSLVPYIVVNRPSNIYTYRFIDKNIGSGTSVDYGGGSVLTQGYISNNIYPLEANGVLNANNIALHKDGDVTGSSVGLDVSGSYSR